MVLVLVWMDLLFANNGFRLIGFYNSYHYDEQILEFNFEPEIKVHINAPSAKSFNPESKVVIALYALPNGNSTAQTIGKTMQAGDDWHFDIQHISAQTRFIRNSGVDYNFVTVYLENDLLSWPAWKAKYSNHHEIISTLVEKIQSIFSDFETEIVLTGHSGGGRFDFSFIDHHETIPQFVKRIAFLDSNYGYDDSYGAKFVNWLNASDENMLFTLAYNDSVALYNGQPIVSATGGTWYRTRWMQRYLSNHYEFETIEDSNFISHTALNGRIRIILKKNPEQKILHTVQVEKNGFIHSILSNTHLENVAYEYYGDRAYTPLIQKGETNYIKLNIPSRPDDAVSGSEFMTSVQNLSFEQRKERLYEEISNGNIPNFLRTLTKINTSLNDNSGVAHAVSYEVMPDYLAVGSDEDFCRVPMGPISAQKIADLFGMTMPTRKLVDDIYINCDIKLEPVTYPRHERNTLVPKFVEHNDAIETQRETASARLGQLVGGTKKDVVISNLIVDPTRPNKVVIYGWHKLDGTPWQPLYNGHTELYVDYSHGIRLINNLTIIDSNIVNLRETLKDDNDYKIFSDEVGPMNQPSYLEISGLPFKPNSFGVISEEGDKLKIVLEQDDNVEFYKAYLSADGINFGTAIELDPNNLVIDELYDNKLVFVKIRAVNSIGESNFSEVLGIGIPHNGSTPQGLIVNGFDRASDGNTFDFIRIHGKAFFSKSFFFNSATNEAISDGLFDLKDYEMVDYILGEESTFDETFNETEQLLFSAYLDNGGNLFVSGSEIAWDLDYKGSTTDKSFIKNYLKIRYLNDAPNNTKNVYYTASGLDGSYFQNLSTVRFDNGTHGTYNVDWPDVFGTSDGGIGAFEYSGLDTTAGFAGVSYHGNFPNGSEVGKVIVLGFPFETIYPEETRNELAEEILIYFDQKTNIQQQKETQNPRSFTLSQNYPNPFNPSTTINYTIPKQSYVSLKIYDELGRIVAELVNGLQSPGNYNVKFDATNLATGVYFYRISAGDLIETKKMILMK